MKKIIYILLSYLCLLNLPLEAQIKTRDSREDIAINGIKFGYIYTVEQLKKALGEPTDYSSWEATDYGKGHSLIWGEDLEIRYNDDPRENDPGIICFYLDTDKYTLDIKGQKLKIGEPFDKVKKLPGFTKIEERAEGFFVIIFDNNLHDESIWIKPDDKGRIKIISIEPRYY